MRAALEGQTETVKALLESGANANEIDDECRTALMFAVTNIHNDRESIAGPGGRCESDS
jgi:ankyrin repeat protein